MRFLIAPFLIVFTSGIFAQNTYYIDATAGNDSWIGNSPSTAWQTLNKVNTSVFQPGDSILFKRGECWRRQLFPSSGSLAADVYYGAFGSGSLPLIMGSENMNQSSDWIEESTNIWLCTSTAQTDVGNIIFDNESHAGIKKWTLVELQSQDDFHFNLSTGELRMYSVGNPATVHTNIECALREHVVNQSNRCFITYENLAIKYGAAHGFGGENTSNITIRNCEISWIGGGDLNLDGQVRFGNAIEFWMNGENHLVENNMIWEIYDTGVTNQGSGLSIQKNIVYRNNVIWNCGMAALEIWNQNSTAIIDKIYFENNTCVNIGYGWGSQRPDYMGFCYAAWSNIAQTDSVFIRNNIFANPSRGFHVYDIDSTFENIVCDYNCYYADSPLDTFMVNYGAMQVYTMQEFNTYQTHINDDWNSILNDPLFSDSINFNYRLSVGSPCIDSALNTGIPYDHDEISRPQGNGYDIGAYEFLSTDIPENASQWKIYPNPASKFITIEGFTDGIIDVFDDSGRFIETKYTNSIDVSDYSQGLYIILIHSNNKTTTQNFIVY
ncbi:MAG: T9SS type A sorting domain-containing protein [Bacteroidales bacterium]|nr:T9SS type A sorting domain-containing protein [Bacteroidales bacterium]